MRAGGVGQPQAEEPRRRGVDHLQPESLSGLHVERLDAAGGSEPAGADGVPARPPTFMPLVSTVCPSLTGDAGVLPSECSGMSPAANAARRRRPRLSIDRRGLAQRFRRRHLLAGSGPPLDPRRATGRRSLPASLASVALQTVTSLSTRVRVCAADGRIAVRLQRRLVRIGDDDRPVHALEDLIRGRVMMRVVPEHARAASP